MTSKTYSFAMLSHPGRVRKGNEDTCVASKDGCILVVCDGMGGAAAGEVASRLAADTFLEQLMPGNPAKTPRTATPDVRLEEAIRAANLAVYQQSRSSPDLYGMGTTLVALMLEVGAGNSTGRPSLTLAHVGDSRCYRFRKGELTQLTLDHSLVEEQVRAGEITAAEAEHHPMRNIITRAVGSSANVEPDIQHLESESGDLYLLASDGLTRDLKDAELAAVFTRALARGKQLNLQSICQTLIDEANDAGGGDNITVLLLAMP